jgi:hypothetical protein
LNYLSSFGFSLLQNLKIRKRVKIIPKKNCQFLSWQKNENTLWNYKMLNKISSSYYPFPQKFFKTFIQDFFILYDRLHPIGQRSPHLLDGSAPYPLLSAPISFQLHPIFGEKRLVHGGVRRDRFGPVLPHLVDQSQFRTSSYRVISTTTLN